MHMSLLVSVFAELCAPLWVTNRRWLSSLTSNLIPLEHIAHGLRAPPESPCFIFVPNVIQQ